MLQTFHTIKSARVKAIDFSKQRNTAALALYSGELILFDHRQQKILQRREISASPLRCVRFYKNYLITASDDGFLRVLDEAQLSTIQEVRACQDFLRAVEVVDDIIFTVGDDGKLRVWQFSKEFRLIAEGKASDGFAMGLSLSRDKKRLATAGQDGCVRIWDVSIFNDQFEARLQKGDFEQFKQSRQEKTQNFAETAVQLTKTAKSLAKNSLQGILTASPLIPTTLHLRALLSDYTPNFTLHLHDGCCNSCDFCDCPALQQVNPYAESTEQFIASCGDDNNVLISDLFSRQVVKKFEMHKDCVSCVRHCPGEQSLFSASEDNTVSVIDLTTFEVERTLNYSLERAWCVSSTNDGVSSIIAVGFDQGVIFAKFGDNKLIWDQRGSKTAVQARYLEAAAEFVCESNAGVEIFSDTALTQSKNFEIPPSQRIQFSPNAKILACEQQEMIRFYSVSTGKEKMQEQAKSLAFATEFIPDEFEFSDKIVEGLSEEEVRQTYQQYSPEIEESGLYAVIPTTGKREVSLKENEDVISYTELDFAPRTLFSGPILAVSGASEIAFYNWELQFLTSLQLSVNNVIFNAAGDVMLLITDKTCFVCSVNLGAICTREIDEVDGLDDSVTVFGELEGVRFAGIQGSILVYSDGDALYEVFLHEMLAGEAEAMRIGQPQSVVDIMSVEEGCVVALCENEGKISVLRTLLDRAIMDFRNCVASGDFARAIQICRSEFAEDAARVLTACDVLVREGRVDLLVEISENPDIQLQVCLKYSIFGGLSGAAAGATHLLRKRQAAELMVHEGMLSGAAAVYRELGDFEMELLCAYVLGDSDVLEHLCDSKNARVAFRARTVLGRDVGDLLLSPHDRAACEWAASGPGELCAAWKEQCKNRESLE